MKIAICLSGHLRTFDKTFRSIKEKLLDVYDCDVFISTWNNLGNFFCYGAEYKEGIDKNDPVVDKDEIIKLYSPISIKMDDAESDPISNQIKKDYYGMKAQNQAQIAQTMIMFYKIWECNYQKKQYELKNNFKYDITIRNRFDLYVKNINTDMAKKCVQFLPGHIGINDMMFVGPNQEMDDVCDIYTIMSPNIDFSQFVNAEHILFTHVMNNNIPFNVSYDAFDYNRYNFRGIYDPKGNKIE